MKNILRIRMAFLLGCIMLSSCATDTLQDLKEGAVKNPEPAAKYLALGDSYTLGEGVTATESWPMQLSALLATAQMPVGEPLVLGEAKWTSGDLLKYLRSVSLPNDYGMVSLMIGKNNQALGRNQQEFRTEIRFLLTICTQLAKKNPKHVMVFTIPNWGLTPSASGKDQTLITNQIRQFNQIIQEEAKTAGVPLVDVSDLSTLVSKIPSLLATDQLHYSGAMYAQWAKRAFPIATEILTK